jgi:hypothetical protein
MHLYDLILLQIRGKPDYICKMSLVHELMENEKHTHTQIRMVMLYVVYIIYFMLAALHYLHLG